MFQSKHPSNCRHSGTEGNEGAVMKLSIELAGMLRGLHYT
jgi:hypothetical protein